MRRLSVLLAILVACPGLLGAGGASTSDDRELVQGIEHFEAGRYERAAEHFRRALDSPESRPSAHYYLGRIHLAEGDSERAVDELEGAVEGREDDPDVHYWLGRALLDEVDKSHFPPRQLLLARSARSHFARAVELDADHIDARTWLANYLISAPGIAGGSREEAFEQAEEIERRDLVAGHRLRATLYWKTEEHGKALAEYQAILDQDPEDVDSLYQAGKLHLRLGDHERAFESLERAVGLDPEHASALYALGQNGAVSGVEPERSLDALRAYLEIEPTPPPRYRASAHWRMGEIYERLGRRAEALDAYREALAIAPDHEQARTALRELEAEVGRGG